MAGVGITLLLGVTNEEQLCQFLHGCIDNQVGKNGSSLNNMNSDIDWSQEDYEEAGKFVQEIFSNLVTKSDYKIEEQLSELGTDKIETIKECYQIRKPELQRSVTNKCLAKMDCPLVTDFDWKLKWVLGSSSLSSLREPLLQMDLNTIKIDQDDNVTKDIVKFEMNLAELESFISKTEKCLSEFKD